MRYLGEVKWFLGIKIVKNKTTHCFWLFQDSYIDKLASKFHLSTEKKFPETLLPTKELFKSTSQATSQKIFFYQQRVGSFNFAAVITQADIADSTLKLS